MTREEAIESFKRSNEQAKVRLKVEKMRMDIGEIKELEFYIERDEMALKALDLGDVLQNVKQEISTIPLTDGDGHNGHWFRAPQAIIKDVNVIIDKFINEVEQ